MNLNLRLALVAGTGWVLLGCGSVGLNQASLPGPADAVGRQLYISKCARCHKFHHLANYNDADWQKWFGKMSRKARLSSPEHELLSKYLAAFRATDGSTTPGAAKSP